MAKRIFYKEEARLKIFKGVEALYKAVSETYGPRGGNVIIGRGFGAPTVTHDGVTVAESIELPVTGLSLGYNEGVELIKQAASKLNKQVGDGTTTVTILTYWMIKYAHELLDNKVNPQVLRRELEAAGEHAVKLLSNMSSEVKDVAEVATISAGSEELGKLIADVFKKVGKDGVITVEEGQGLEITSEFTEGFVIPKGFVSNFFINDKERQRVSFEKPAIIVTNEKFEKSDDLLPLIQKVAKEHQDILLVCDDIEGSALGDLVMGKLNGLHICVVKAPYFGDKRTDALQDIARMSGATLISKENGVDIKTADISVVGTAEQVIVDKDTSTFIKGGGNLAEYVKELKAQEKNAVNQLTKDSLSERIASLTGKAAIIKIGGSSETEIEEVKYRVDDAVAATKAALAEGIVPGGGVTLLNIARRLPENGMGFEILQKTLKQPMIKLLDNAGFNGAKTVEHTWEYEKDGIGVDVRTKNGEAVDVKKAGIIDPVKVTRECLLSAISVASTAITMTALIVELPEEA